MLPKRSEWKSWSALDRVTYVTQLAAALALLPTVIFAFLGWREARLTRDDQIQFFLAEKAPQLEVSDISVATGLLTIEFNNTGESLAKNIRLKLTVVDSKSGEVKSVPLLDILEKAPLSVSKNHKIVLPVQSNIELEKIVGFIPRDIRLYDIKTVDKSGQFHPVLYVIAEYTDIRERAYIAAATAKLVE